jgi:hypothetical protein
LNFDIIDSAIIFFTIGIILGSLSLALIVKHFIHKRLKNFYNLLNELTLYRLRFKKEQEKKINALKKIKEKIYNPKKVSEHSYYENFSSYLSVLNQILYENRISQIEDNIPPF